MATDLGGVWRTIGGRRVFIKDGEDLSTAMKNSGKFKSKKEEPTRSEKPSNSKNQKKNSELTDEERKQKIEELEKKKDETQGFLQKGAIQEEINMVKDGFDGTKEEYREYVSKEQEKRLAEYRKEKEERLKIYKEQNNNEDDYRMSHRPTETGLTADDLLKEGNEGVSAPKDIYEHPEYYSSNNEKWNKETIEQLKSARGNEDAEITIYRATTGDTINKGDWVTLSKSYAEAHNESQLGGKGKVLEMKVKAKDVQFAGDMLEEWGYFPKTESSSKTNNDFSIKTTKDRSIKDLYKKSLYKNGKEAGYIEYYDKNNKINIITMKTTDEFKRQGVASNLFDNLKEEKGDITYKVTAVLGDGEKFLESKTNIIKKEDRDFYVKIKSSTTPKTSNAKGTNSIYMKAYREYLKEHPNSKLTFKSFKEMNYN